MAISKFPFGIKTLEIRFSETISTSSISMRSFSMINFIAFRNSVSEIEPSPYHKAIFFIHDGRLSAEAFG